MSAEHRDQPRVRTLLSGTVIIRSQNLVVSVLVKDFSGTGARLKFGGALQIPDSFEFAINGKPERYTATCAWRNGDSMGVRLTPLRASEEELANRIRAVERERKQLLSKLERLNTGW